MGQTYGETERQADGQRTVTYTLPHTTRALCLKYSSNFLYYNFNNCKALISTQHQDGKCSRHNAVCIDPIKVTELDR